MLCLDVMFRNGRVTKKFLKIVMWSNAFIVILLYSCMVLQHTVFADDNLLKPIFHCDAKPFALGTGVGCACQWNIGSVGSQTQISRVGRVHFFFLC